MGRCDVFTCTCVFGPLESVSVSPGFTLLLESPVDDQAASAGAVWRVFSSSFLGGSSELPGRGNRPRKLLEIW